MRPLLWKEMRDLRGLLVAGSAAMGLLGLLLATRVLHATFVGVWMYILMPFTAALAAIGLAVGQVARERHNRTLDYLLVRPIPAGVIVWSKFLAGSLVLAVLM